MHGGFIALQLLLQFGNFQNREQLALFYVRAPVDIEFLNVSGNFGVDVDLLKGLEFGGDFERAGEILPAGLDDGHARGVRRHRRRCLCRLSRSLTGTLTRSTIAHAIWSYPGCDRLRLQLVSLSLAMSLDVNFREILCVTAIRML